MSKGPLSVAIKADGDAFMLYKSGVITIDDCGYQDETDLDHAVLAVGYDKDENGQLYYLVKNSWGKGWGDNGFVRIAAEKNGPGACGI